LQEKLKGHVEQIVVLRSESSKTERAMVSKLINSPPKKGSRVIIATGKLIGEGFDCPYLDTLFLTLPISWKGTLQQYVGRLHRQYEGKKKVVVYDYCDGSFTV